MMVFNIFSIISEVYPHVIISLFGFFLTIAVAAVFALVDGALLVLFRESFMMSTLHKDRG